MIQLYTIVRQEMSETKNVVKIEAIEGKPVHFGAEYMGGHKMYPKKTDCNVRLFSTKMEIEFGLVNKHTIVIPYNSITSMESEDEKRITKTRILLTGIIVGLLWKKKFRYTVIEYEDMQGIKQAVVVDFHRKAEKAQQVIYEKMSEAKEQV